MEKGAFNQEIYKKLDSYGVYIKDLEDDWCRPIAKKFGNNLAALFSFTLNEVSGLLCDASLVLRQMPAGSHVGMLENDPTESQDTISDLLPDIYTTQYNYTVLYKLYASIELMLEKCKSSSIYLFNTAEKVLLYAMYEIALSEKSDKLKEALQLEDSDCAQMYSQLIGDQNISKLYDIDSVYLCEGKSPYILKNWFK